MASMSVSGVVSGMDWESMIDEIITAAAKPAQVKVNKKTNLTNKKSLFEEMKVTMNSIQSSLSPLKLPSTYKAKEVEIERVDTTGSYKGVLTATVNADAEVSVHDIVVKQLARAQVNRSKQITASTLKSTLGGLTGKSIYVNAAGQKIGVEVEENDSLQSLKSKINTALKTTGSGINVTASVVDNRLIFKSDNTGLGTNTVNGTLQNTYSSGGVSSLKNVITNSATGATTDIYVDENNADRLTVTSGSKRFVIHQDYEVVNGEIRWKQYNDTNEIKLGESVSATYTMAVGDSFTTDAVTRGSSDSDSVDFGFTVKDEGTLSQRMTITGTHTETTTETSYGGSGDGTTETETTTETDDDGNRITTTVTTLETLDDDGAYIIQTTTTTVTETDYTYGKDFTYSSGKITWLDEESETNEPDSYTVSFTQDNSVSYELETQKGTSTTAVINEPASYTISYSNTTSDSLESDSITRQTTTTTTEPDSYSVKIGATASGTAGFTITTSSSGYWTENITIENLDDYKTYYEEKYSSVLETVTIPSTKGNLKCFNPSASARSDFALSVTKDSTTTTYEYGKDFIIGTNDGGETYKIVWASQNGTSVGSGVVNTYRSNYAADITDTPLQYPSTGSAITLSMPYSYDKTISGSVNASDNDKTLATVFGENIDSAYHSTLKIKGYTYGTDYTVDTDEDGDAYIKWLDQDISSGDDEGVFDYDSFNAAYKTATGSDDNNLPTITLTGSDGIIRTYVDPDDLTDFTITDDNGKTYEYGRDFVIRVDDDGDGYSVSWFAASSTDTAKEAQTAVAAYASYKNISTSGFQSAPSYGTDYTINFSHSQDNSYTADVNSTDSDKNIESLLGTSIDDYSDLVVTDSDGNEYYYGSDFTIDSDGNIEWTATDTDERSNEDEIELDFDELSELYETATGEELSLVSLTGSDGVTRTYLDIDSDYADLFSMKSYNDETEYEYGRDYVIRLNDEEDGYVVSWLVAEDNNTDGILNINDANLAVTTYASYKGISISSYEKAPEVDDYFTFSFAKEILDTTEVTVKASDTDKSLETIFGEDYELDYDDYENIVITDSDGNTYTYGTDYDINSDGEIEWLSVRDVYTPLRPDKGDTYTITYSSFEALEGTAVYDEDSSTTALTFAVDSGYGDVDDETLSYEQIYEDLGLDDDSDDDEIYDAFESVFTLTDDEGNTYTYGNDYTIEAGDDVSEDSDDSLHMPVIKWTTSGSKPDDGAELTMIYTGRGSGGGETFEIDEAVTRSNTDIVMSGISGSPSYDDFEDGTTTITLGTKVYYQDVDFEIGENDSGNVTINWKTGTDYEWYYPTPSSTYIVNLVTSDGETKTYSGTRANEDVLDLRDYGFNSVNGAITSVKYGGTNYDLTYTTDDEDESTPAEVLESTLGLKVNTGTNGVTNVYKFDWLTPTDRTANTNLPNYGDEISIEYEYDENTFTLSDDADGELLELLELDQEDDEHYTAAQDAIIMLDDNEITRASNDIGESYSNEISALKGVTLHLKGEGEVSLDISHDAEKAVEGIQTLVENYNSLMSWINTRMTESEVDEDTAATIDSDDFRMRWGLLHGNSLLRNTKSQLRNIVAQNFTYSFTSRTSANEIYGDMSFNGLTTSSTLRLRIGSTYSDITIDPTDTLETIIAKINDDSTTSQAKNMHYDENGNKRAQPLLKASIENDKLVISSTSTDEITISGTAAMKALQMNYTYKGVYQLGIATTSDDYGKSGELEFDTEKFMEALEDNPEETQELMLKFVTEMDSWCKSMLTASGDTKGTLTREIDNIQSQIDDINEYLEKYQDRLDRMEESLRSKYSAAETQISKLSQQASAISSILQQMTGNNNSTSSSSAS